MGNHLRGDRRRGCCICGHIFYDESIIHMRNIIKQLRKEAGFRQEDMAKELGVSRQTIIAIENDKYNPTLELAVKIARLPDRHVEDIFFL